MQNLTQAAETSGESVSHTSSRRLRLVIFFAVTLGGLLLMSMPAWLITGPKSTVLRAIVGGIGAVLVGAGLASYVTEHLDPVKSSVMEAFELQLVGGNSHNFRGVVHREVASALGDLSAGSTDFGPRGRLFSRLALSRSEQEIVIQGISLSQKWQMAQLLEDLFRRHPEFRTRILLMHPYSPHAEHRDADLNFRPGTIRQLIDETIVPLGSLQRSMGLGDRLQVRGYFAIPYFGFTCCDEQRMMLSLSRERRGGDQNLGIYLEASGSAASQFLFDVLAGFEQRWEASQSLLDYLSIQFSPGSEHRTSGRLHFDVESDRDLAITSMSVECDHGSRPQTERVGDNRYRISLQDSSVDQTVTIREALSADRTAWLRNPVEIVIPRGI